MTQISTWRRIARRVRVPLGFVVAALFLFLARPTPASMLWSLLLVAPGVSLRAYASGYVRKNSELTTTGPYAHTRNPLYLGSLSIAFGFAAAAASWTILLALGALFAIIYLPTIAAEEEYLHERFDTFDRYAAQVPRILPRLTPAVTGTERGQFSSALYLHHREYNCLAGAIAIYAALALKLWLLKL